MLSPSFPELEMYFKWGFLKKKWGHFFCPRYSTNLSGKSVRKGSAYTPGKSWRQSQASSQFVTWIAVYEYLSDHNALSDDIRNNFELRITMKELLSDLWQIMDRRNSEIHRINDLLGIISLAIIINATHK